MKHILKVVLPIAGLICCLSVKAVDGYRLTLSAQPAMAGTFNLAAETSHASDTVVELQAYANSGFTFVHWTDAGGTVLSEERNLSYTMPESDTRLIAVYEYDPANPGHPSLNYWNAATGEVVIDTYQEGRLQDAVKEAIGDSKASEVTQITVAGVMNSNDFGIINTYSQCRLLDISRVTGGTQIPSYAFDNTLLEQVYLPASVERIKASAFRGCASLSAVTVYALIPPVLESNVFGGVSGDMIVYVPAAALTLYMDAAGWKNLTIMPVQEDIRSITVSLPANVASADYKQMWLELTNNKSGQRLHYVMTERREYTFANIIRNTQWNIVLRNERGDIFGQIDNINVEDDDVSVQFASLAKPQNVTLSLLTPSEENVAEQAQITWTDASGAYVGQGTTVAGLPAGCTLKADIVLSQEQTMLYAAPQPVEHTVSATDNAIICRLNAIRQVPASGKVTDENGIPLSEAVVSVSQTFGGKYSRTVNAQTGRDGTFSLNVYCVPSSVSFAASTYMAQTLTIDTLSENTQALLLPEVSLATVSGVTIHIGFTYTPSVQDGEELETQNGYAGRDNVAYTVFNVTKNQEIRSFQVQYPQIVLTDGADEADVLRLIATGLAGGFAPVEQTAVIEDGKASVTFDIVELGGIQATYRQSGNEEVTASLYDASGKLVKTSSYILSSLAISNLPDGQYTLVSMGKSRLFNTVYDLQGLKQTGLKEGSDYVKQTVNVHSGSITAVEINEVPLLDESKLYYTGNNTSFSVNKTEIVIGNYLTLTGHIDFKSAYSSKVSDVQLIVELPASSSFVENSVMVGNTISGYVLDGNRLTIPMERYSDRVRFCIIPTESGTFAPSALVRFDIDGKTITQPIGAANFTAKNLSISVPSVVNKTLVPVSGTAIGTSNIEIYDNDVLIGQTTSLANGTWTTTCELNGHYNLLHHQIYAKVTTKQGIELTSEKVSCVYDMNAIQVSVVKMYHENPEMNKNYELTFDFLNPSSIDEYYIYYIYNKKFTFTIDFTNNDTTKISNVILYVKTAKSGWHPLEATYDVKQDKWVAAGEFGNMYDGDLPVNVSVDFDTYTTVFFDDSELEDMKDNGLLLLQDYVTTAVEVDSLYLDAINKLSFDNFEEVVHSSINDILAYSGTSLNEIGVVTVDLEAEVFVSENEIDLANIDRNYNDFLSSINISSLITEFEDAGFYLTVQSCEDITEGLLNEYEKVANINGDFVYYQSSDTYFSIICPRMNLFMTIRESMESQSNPRWVYSAEEAKTLSDWASKIADVAQILEKKYPLADAIKDATLKYNSAKNKLAQTQFMLNNSERELSKAMRKKLLAQSAEYSKQLAKAQRYLRWLNGLGRALPIVNVVKMINDLSNNVKELHSLYISVPDPCDGDKTKADKLHKDIFTTGVAAGIYGVGQATLCAHEIGLLIPSIAAAYSTGGTSLLAEIALISAQVAAGWLYDSEMERRFTEYRQRIKQLKCKIPPPGGDNGNGGHPSHNPDKKFGIDPSGYVYEAVCSNRVEGVTATIYYKETVEDMYGDLHENIVKWDAEEYAQQNPLFTDENGMYRWDVPKGLWQVRFEKDGYETAYSDWLPVPPPQLDVNITIRQNRQPEVRTARAYEDAVEMEFDKYMMPEYLTADNIVITENDIPVDGTVVLLNEEADGEGQTFASKVRFNAARPFEEKEITLMVSSRVRSYAGIRMQDDYQQSFTVEQEIQHIACKEHISIGYGKERTLTVSVTPASAAADKMLELSVSSDKIISVSSVQTALDDEGKATVTVYGELPGTAALTFSVQGTDKTATSLISVETDWQPEEYAITYGNLYDATNDNPTVYTEEEEIVLVPAGTRNGYTFKEWKDEDGNIVTGIAKGTTGNIALNAVWEAVTYTIRYQYKNGEEVADNPNRTTYTIVDAFDFLSLSSTNGAVFLEWHDEDDDPIMGITEGSTGNRVITAIFKDIPTYMDAIDTHDMQGVRKVVIDGRLYIIRNGRVYSATGEELR